MSSRYGQFHVVGQKIVEGVPPPSSIQWPAIQRPSANHWVVFVEVPALNFGGLPFLAGLNLWPGGEWHNRQPLWRKARDERIDPRKFRQTLERAEVWTLKKYEQLLLVDRFGGVRILKRDREQLELAEATPEELATYISGRGVAMTTHQGALWAVKNLERLQEGFTNFDFAHSLTVLRQRLAQFEVKIG